MHWNKVLLSCFLQTIGRHQTIDIAVYKRTIKSRMTAMTKYIKTCTELSHPGCLLLQFYALNYVFNHIYAGIIAHLFVSLTYMYICLKVNSYKSESIQRGNLQDLLD